LVSVSDDFLRALSISSELLGELCVPKLRVVGCNLHRGGQELLVVTTDMALQQGQNLIRSAHLARNYRPLRLRTFVGPELHHGSAQ
jgi:hypothetical protein